MFLVPKNLVSFVVIPNRTTKDTKNTKMFLILRNLVFLVSLVVNPQ